MADHTDPPYGNGDASFRAAGGETGIRQLVDTFYDAMDARDDCRRIRAMHPPNLDESRDKLARFLCGWMNGPKRYQEKYGPISIPGVHAHLRITENDRDAWLACMREALDAQPYEQTFREYLMRELAVPANRVVKQPGDKIVIRNIR